MFLLITAYVHVACSRRTRTCVDHDVATRVFVECHPCHRRSAGWGESRGGGGGGGMSGGV